MSLNIDFNMGAESDALFNTLLAAHEGLSPSQSEQLNAALILLLVGYALIRIIKRRRTLRED